MKKLLLLFMICLFIFSGCGNKEIEIENQNLEQLSKDGNYAYPNGVIDTDNDENKASEELNKAVAKTYACYVDLFLMNANNNDVDGIFNMFSESKKKENPNLYVQTQDFLGEYPTNAESYSREIKNVGQSDKRRDGKVVKEEFGQVYVCIDGKNYYYYFNCITRNDIDPNDVGLNYILVCSEEVYNDKDFIAPNDKDLNICLAMK